MEADDEVRVLVLASAHPEFFVAHADVGMIIAMPDDPRPPLKEPNVAVAKLDRLRAMPKATIAAVGGIARGGGSELALACDLRFASRSARFGQPEVALGILPGAGGTQRLSRLVGRARALEIVLGCGDVSGEEAAAIGLVNRVLDDHELVPFVRGLARRIASMPSEAVGLSKQAVDAAWPPAGPGFLVEGDAFHELMTYPEAKERMRAFRDLGGQTADGERDLGAIVDRLGRA